MRAPKCSSAIHQLGITPFGGFAIIVRIQNLRGNSRRLRALTSGDNRLATVTSTRLFEVTSRTQARRPAMRGSRLVILVICAICFGCASNDPYPENWSPVVVGQTGCPDISGIYKNGGLGTNSQSTRMEQLSEIFLGNSRANEETISIDQSEDGRMQILIHDNDQSPESRTLSLEDGDFECDDGKIWVTLAKDFDIDFAAVGGDITKMGFARAEDGSLVGEERYVLAGVLVVVPMRVSEKSYVHWKAIDRQFGVNGRTRMDMRVHQTGGVDKKQLNDVDACTLYVYTMGSSVSLRLFIDATHYADAAITGSEYGQLSLKEGSYRIAATDTDGVVGEFDMSCYTRWIGGRQYSKHYLQLHRSPDGRHSATKQPVETAIRHMSRGVLSVDRRSQVDLSIGPRSDLRKDELQVDGRCVVYFFMFDREASPRLSARLYVNRYQYADMVLAKSQYARLTLDQDVNSITAVLADGSTGTIKFTCLIPSSIHIAMFHGVAAGINRLDLQPGGLGIRRLTAIR
jgi:hypothetical protein